MDRRPPDFVVGEAASPYLRRWWLIPRNPIFNAYLHEFRQSDDDRALHDHPWLNASLLLSGFYREHMQDEGGPDVERMRHAGDVIFRRPTTAHRVELLHHIGDGGGLQPLRACTLFLTGPRIRAWGFLCPKGWRHWRDFTNPADGGRTIGRGCE